MQIGEIVTSQHTYPSKILRPTIYVKSRNRPAICRIHYNQYVPDYRHRRQAGFTVANAMIVTSAAGLIIIFATPDKTPKTSVSASIDTMLREVSHAGE
jgi:hypothetical protein